MHQPLDRAACHRNASATQLPPDLARSVRPEDLLPEAVNRAGDLAIARTTRRQARRIHLPALVLVIRRRGDRQLLVDRVDPVLGPMRACERDQYFPRQSSSAWVRRRRCFAQILIGAPELKVLPFQLLDPLTVGQRGVAVGIGCGLNARHP